jgi:hypothetical protein
MLASVLKRCGNGPRRGGKPPSRKWYAAGQDFSLILLSFPDPLLLSALQGQSLGSINAGGQAKEDKTPDREGFLLLLA